MTLMAQMNFVLLFLYWLDYSDSWSRYTSWLPLVLFVFV
jgi:hypothetical protein